MTGDRTEATLLVFTLGAAAECRRRRLLPRDHRKAELELWQRCLEEAVAAGREAGCRVVVSSPPGAATLAGVTHLEQRGDSFSARLSDALERARPTAGGPVIVVGTDAPGLCAAHIETALARLADGGERVVVGPSPDGGFYLLAARRRLDDVLPGVRWCSRHARASLQAALARVGAKVSLLPPLLDLDRRGDLERWLAGRAPLGAAWRQLVGSLRALLAALRRPTVPPRLGRVAGLGAVSLRVRGPPA